MDLIDEILRSNGWNQELVAERVGDCIRVRRRSDASDVVNDYPEAAIVPEQVMQECLRFLRTGRIGA